MSWSLFRACGESYPDLALKPSFLQDAENINESVKIALNLSLWLVVSSISMMSQTKTTPSCPTTESVLAAPVDHEIPVNAAKPAPEWQSATPIVFCRDWQGKDPAPDRETRVQVLWSAKTLFLRFECRYRELHVFDDSEPNGRRDQLWDRDVAEAFLQPDPTRPTEYKEFEVSPNGFWIDLDISPGQKPDLKSGMRRSVILDERARTWIAELAIPMKALAPDFNPSAVWRVNFFRVEGNEEPRGYYAWRPTGTPQPNFHVPSAFGQMRFLSSKR